MKSSVKLLFSFLLTLVLSITSKNPRFIDSSFLPPSKLIQSQLQIDYILDAKSDFDEALKQFLTELLENSLQVTAYLLQETPTTLSLTTSTRSICPEFDQFTSPQILLSDIILLIANDKNSKKSLNLQDCSSTLYPQKFGLIKVNIPLLLKENDNSAIYTIVESLSKTYFKNTKILEKLDELFNSNLGISCAVGCKVCNTNTGTCTTCYDSTHMKIKNGVCYCTDPNAVYFSPAQACVCKNGYYSNTNDVCTLCPAICATCSSSTSCLSCINPNQMTFYNNWCYCSNPEGSVFNPTLNTCVCPNDTWLDGGNCQACNSTCSTCTNNNTCTSCRDPASMNFNDGICSCKDDDSFFNETSGLCECKEGYYMDEGFCQACQAQCYTCSNSTFCDSCIDSSMILDDGDCSCPRNKTFNATERKCDCGAGYFINDDEVCESCSLPCATCNNILTCLTCIDPGAMYNEDGICDCDPGMNFNTTTRECDCAPGTYREDSNCYQCPSGCSECTNATHCLACYSNQPWYNPYSLVNSSCECPFPYSTPSGWWGCGCIDGYYANLSSNAADWCTPCPITCSQCMYSTDNAANQDISCQDCVDPNMSANINGLCVCPPNSYFSHKLLTCYCDPGYFMANKACNSCSLPCGNCTLYNSCTSCALPSMTLSNNACICTSPNNSVYNSTLNECVCPDRTYQSGNSCLNCYETCITCENSNECLSCADPVHMTLGNNGTCACPNNSTFNGQNCVCENGFWQGSECIECQPPCRQCENKNYCLSCLYPFMYPNNGMCSCTDPNSHINNQNDLCVCNDGFFMDNQYCCSCPNACSTCESYQICTSCVNNLSLINGICNCTSNSYYNNQLNECVCNPGTYQNNTNCDSCPETCGTCESSTECLSCKDPYHMILESNGACACLQNSTFNGKLCVCGTHYFWNHQECSECEFPCQECEDYSECLSCLDPNNMFLSNGTCYCNDPNASFDFDENLCVCNDGYYTINSACWLCPITCSTCESKNNCTSCVDESMSFVNGVCTCSDPNSSFNVKQQKCVCNQGYKDFNGVCVECPIGCSLCAVSNVCIECENPEEMTIISDNCVCNQNNTIYDSSTNSCICKNQYYYDGSECIACQSPMCAICKNDRCLSCIDSVNMTLSSGICYCKDENSFFNTSSGLCQCSNNFLPNLIENALQCIPISSPCREFSIDGLCIKCIDKNMKLYQGQCYCTDPNASFNVKTQNCSCNIGYQLTNIDDFCYPCDSYLYGGIKGCASCNNGECITCQENMQLISGKCYCQPGFVWDNILSACICAPGFWNSTECPSCGCYSCYTNGTCMEPCSQNSTWIDGLCRCNEGFYSCGDNTCCDLTRTCAEFSGDNCTNCIEGMYLTNSDDCMCSSHTYNATYNYRENICECPQGTFNMSLFSSLSTCASCKSYCNDCIDNEDCMACQAPFVLQNGNCTCDPNAIQIWDNCICEDGYYMDSTYSCLPCPGHCETCISANICTSCKDNLYLANNACFCSDINAVYNIETSQCECAAGYYSQGNKCIACLAECFDCLEDGVTCISCADEDNMILSGGICSCEDPNAVFNTTTLKCECEYGEYNGVCSACSPGCANCQHNRCLKCYDSKHMALVENLCTCKDPNAYFVEWAKVCTCKDGFYYNGQICASFPGLIFNK